MMPEMLPPDEGIEPSSDPSLGWVADLVRRSAPPSEGFLTACERGAEVGFALIKLRRASQRLEGALLSAPEYTRGLIAVAQVAPEPVHRWAGLTPDFRPDRGWAAGWGRLALALGLGLREAILRLRFAFAEDLELGLVPVQARGEAFGPGAAPSLAEWEEGFAAESARLSPESLDRLHECEAAIRLAYAADPPDRRDRDADC